jgi:peptidoglycan/LPS O-acetylase OafA/YrhL
VPAQPPEWTRRPVGQTVLDPLSTAPQRWDEPSGEDWHETTEDDWAEDDWADDAADPHAQTRLLAPAPAPAPPDEDGDEYWDGDHGRGDDWRRADRRPERPDDRRAAHRTERGGTGPVDLGPRLPYVAGFDGLRAVALLAILAFHQGYDLVSGGFLGISSFFTLSGFLVATLLLAEWSQVGGVAVPRFWERRARRLIPPLVAVLAGVVALQVTLRIGAGPRFRGDLVAAAAQILNWRFAIGGDGFASVLTDPSPVQHLWSVSMAAQVFLVLPLAFALLMRVAGARWRLGGAAFGLGAVVSFVAASMTADRAGNDGFAYYGTHTRVGEVLVGVVLAYAVLSPGLRRVMETHLGAQVMRYGPLVALAGLAWLWSTTSLYSSNLFGGVTAVNAVLTAFVVLAVTTPGPASRALGARLPRTLGRISYAAFLVHWPIFLLLDEDRTGLDSHVLFLVRLGATVAVAALSTVVLEQPIRYRLAASRGQLALGLGTCLALVGVVGLVLPEQPPPDVSLTVDDGSGPGDLEAVTPTGGDEVVRIALVGDELAGSMLPGFDAWNAEAADHQVRVDTHVTPRCPVSAPGPVRLAGETVGDDVACIGFGPRLPKLLDASGADAIVVVGGLADLGEREIDRTWRHIGDPVFDGWLADRYDDLADTLAEQDAPVLWATYPHVRLAPGVGDGDWTTVPDNDPLRVERLNEIIRDTVRGRGDFTVIDLDAWSQDLQGGGAFAPEYRSEGRDLTDAGAEAAARWLVPRVLDAAGIEPPEPEAPGGEATEPTAP